MPIEYHPTIPEPFRSTAEELHEALTAHQEFFSAAMEDRFETEPASWYSLLLADLTLIIGGTRIEYAGASIELDRSSGRVVIFTFDVLITVDIAFDEQGRVNSRPRPEAISRSWIRSLMVQARMGVFSEHRGPSWPLGVELEIRYEGQDALKLPLRGPHVYGVTPPDLLPLLESLRADLVGSDRTRV